jgi:hypothetical protein
MSMVYWWNDDERGKPKHLERNLSQYHPIYHKSLWTGFGIEPGPPR